MAIQTARLSSGMPLITERIGSMKSAAICWLLPVGSAHDPVDRQGLSTVLSEMIFRGAGPRDSKQLADDMDSIGLVRGCSVGMIYLRLTASLIGRDLDGALEILRDMVLRPRLDAAALEPARELALQSLAGLRDDPAQYAGVLLNERHAAVPFNRSSLGDEAGLTAITHDDVTRTWKTHVTPQSSILAIAGDVDHDAAAKKLDTLLQGWTGSTPEPVPTTNPLRGSVHHETEDSNQVHIYLAHEAPSEPHADAKLERVVNAVLSGGSASRLFSEVREKRGLCYSVSAGYSADRLFGRVSAYVGTTPERAQQSLDVLMAELHRITTPDGRVTPDELQRAKIGHKSSLVFSGESSGSRAVSLAIDHHRLGRARSLAELAAEAESVTLDQVNSYLARRTMGPTTLVTLGPSPLTRPA